MNELIGSHIRRRKQSGAFGDLLRDESAGNRAAFFPGFEKDREKNQEGSCGVGENDGRGMKEEAIAEPEEHTGEIENQHAVGEIAAALLANFEELRDEGERGAEAGDSAENFDGLRGGHLVEVSWIDSIRRQRD